MSLDWEGWAVLFLPVEFRFEFPMSDSKDKVPA